MRLFWGRLSHEAEAGLLSLFMSNNGNYIRVCRLGWYVAFSIVVTRKANYMYGQRWHLCIRMCNKQRCSKDNRFFDLGDTSFASSVGRYALSLSNGIRVRTSQEIYVHCSVVEPVESHQHNCRKLWAQLRDVGASAEVLAPGVRKLPVQTTVPTTAWHSPLMQ